MGRHQVTSRTSVAVVGGGQAGLATSYCLKKRHIDHVVFEKRRVAHEWRERRWDSFCLVTPNWQCQLPGFPYSGNEPHGFMKKDQIVRYLEDYVTSFEPPLLEGVAVLGLRGGPGGAFEIRTSDGDVVAEQVVVATGGYHTPAIPRIADRLPDNLHQLHSCEYKNPQSLPAGSVLVIGTGQSGCQIAEDLHLAGRRVHLCVGSAPRTARRYRGKDVVEWLDAMGYYAIPVHEHPLKERVRAKANHYVTGRDGGRDIDLRQFALEGMQLHGRLHHVRSSTLELASDLAHNLDQADEVSDSIKASIDAFIASHGIEAPTEPRYAPPWQPRDDVRTLDVRAAGITTVVWCTGFRSDYRWLEVPIFDGAGYPSHQRGVTSTPGLYFVGLPWLHTWGSGRFSGVARDAEYIAECIETRCGNASHPSATALNEFGLGS
ncbi:MAG: MSMEG_0569 family flavin-dependent oxidoreductase [Myxococcota bacterium]|nr:MSMEG_0569 family flavin-dependent oxidoreductase [Myxococcota bacterium]